MQTRQEKINIITGTLLNTHPDDIDGIYGYGSAFQQDLDGRVLEDDNTIDLILFIAKLINQIFTSQLIFLAK